MLTICRTCNHQYDDAQRSTICPHDWIAPPEILARKTLASSLMGKRLVFAHHEHNPPGPLRPIVHIESIDYRGYVTLRGWSGFFDPSLFRLADPT